MADKKDIKYLNRDFNSFRASLIDYTKTYFPTTYNDFSPASPGMMVMEMSAYVGDILSFYLDNQVQETYLQYARQSNNIFELAYMFNYIPKVTGAASTSLSVYQLVPSKLSGSTYLPDFDYALKINRNASVTSTLVGSSPFITQDDVDFTISSSTDPTEITVYQISAGNPTFYLLKKEVKTISATINTTTFSFGSPIKFSTVNINKSKIIDVLDIIDSEGNEWYQVDHLAQDVVYDSLKNTNPNDPNNYQNVGDTPYLLKLKKVQRRFTTRFIDSGSLQLQFGAGTTNDVDENIIPNPDNVGLGLPFGQSKLTTAYSPTNFIFTNTYGIAPSNTTLTVRYLTGGGATANVPSNTLTQISGDIKFLKNNLNSTTANTIYSSLSVNNSEAADGGADGDTLEEIRQNTLSNYSTQLRTVTQDDYLIRAMSMPSKFGVITKAYIEPTKLSNLNIGETPSLLDLYILTYNINKNLNTASTTLKQNLSTYLSQYRMIGDSIRIKDAFIINIGINFDIIVLPDYNNNDVINNCIISLQNYFSIDKWQINQPIILKDIYILLDKIEGVQTVKSVDIINKAGISLGYSQYGYDISGATYNNVVYPSLDPSIFEVRYLNQDINGRVVPL
tara:strand:+ start:2088 stop:3944 length:1857 start_codon:yes stop_codon:yes gene_type:complete